MGKQAAPLEKGEKYRTVSLKLSAEAYQQIYDIVQEGKASRIGFQSITSFIEVAIREKLERDAEAAARQAPERSSRDSRGFTSR